ETLGPMLPEGAAAAAVLWGIAQLCAMTFPDSVRRAGFEGDGQVLGDRLFEAVLTHRSGITLTIDDYDETWRRLDTPDRRLRLAIPELLDELATLDREAPRGRSSA